MEAGQAVSSRLGRITISSEAIAQIVAETALECYGVVGMKGSLRGQLARARGRPRGIEIRRDDGEVAVDLHVVVEYGLNLAEVASTVRSQVSYEVERLTGLGVACDYLCRMLKSLGCSSRSCRRTYYTQRAGGSPYTAQAVACVRGRSCH